jgi:hypothetical protein
MIGRKIAQNFEKRPKTVAKPKKLPKYIHQSSV